VNVEPLNVGPRLVLDGIAMGESPRWHDGRIWFADWMAGQIIAVDDTGTSEVMVRHQSLPLCFDFLPDGTLLVVSSTECALLRLDQRGELVRYADLSAETSHPWNDIVVDGRGNAYVNSIGFDFPGGEFAPGFVVMVRPDGSVQRVAEGLAFPNGMAVTADNAMLIVAESYADCLTAYDVAADGLLSNRRVWASVPGDHPDGICLDADGAAWLADVGSAHCLRVREGGEVLADVRLDRGAFACMLGGNRTPTLYITANAWGQDMAASGGQLLAVDAPAPRAGYPG
jgi:sugar lactone lactonase YvrE